jgi:Chaperone of endosialidase
MFLIFSILMKNLLQGAAVFLLLTILISPSTTARAQGTAFTYQGRLNSGTNPANGSFDLRFALYDAASAGAQQGNLLTNTPTSVSNGLFTVTLDFGNQFPGAPRWLEIAVRTNGVGVFTNLSPRQPLTPAPYAIYAGSANATNLVGTVQTANLSGVALLAGGNAFTGNQTVTSGNVGIGTSTPRHKLDVNGNIFLGTQRNGQIFNEIGDTLYLGAEQKYLGNTLGTPVDGSTDWINLMANPLSAGIIFGLSTSTANPHLNNIPLMVIRSNGNVGIGIGATNPATTLQVAGTVGIGTTVNSSAELSIDQPGSLTQLELLKPGSNLGYQFATDSGGLGICEHNVACGRFYIQNGTGNIGIGTTAPSGLLSVATSAGTLSVVADTAVELMMKGGVADGALRVRNRIEMWAKTNLTAAGYLDVRDTNNNPVISLDGGNGNVTCVAVNITSDRNAKENFSPVNSRAVLDKVASLPITEWQYKRQSDTRHIGPMAQDFSNAFALGQDDKHISVVDEGGVALAAIQGLNEKLEETKAENAQLKQTVDQLKKMVEELGRKVSPPAAN